MAVRITRAGVWLTVGIIGLGLLVLGGLYIAGQRGEQARRDEAIAIAENNLNEQSKNETPVLGGGDDTASEEATSGQTGGATMTEKETSTTDSGSTSSSNATTSTNTAVTELPQTGPSSDIAVIAIIATVTYFVASFISSRKNLLKNTRA
jgi:hypothetical protein